MLAEMPSAPHDVPLREHSHLDLHQDGREIIDSNQGIEDRVCPGCKTPAVKENGGLVVAFGQSFFHVECFKCAKCGEQVTADTNLLLLSDGSPICANCSYSCNVCHLPILDEAIMAGDDSYHAHCFNCKVCKSWIDDLTFAKTSQGIYCMPCHNERMIKIRRHAQKKAEREKLMGGSADSKSREHHHRENERHSPATESNTLPSDASINPRRTSHDKTSHNDSSKRAENGGHIRSPLNKGTPRPYVSDAFEANPQPTGSSSSIPQSASVALPSEIARNELARNNSPSLTYNSSSQETTQTASSSEHSRLPHKQSTLPIPSISADDGMHSMDRRKSYDEGMRLLNASSSDLDLSSNKQGGLAVAGPSRRDKRRSINPGLILPSFPESGTAQTSFPTLSPVTSSFQSQQSGQSGGRSSPRPSESTKATSNSPSSSPALTEREQFYDHVQLPRSRSASATTATYHSEPQAPLRPPLRTILSEDKIPPRVNSLVNLQNGDHGRLSPNPQIPKGPPIRLQKSFDDRLPLDSRLLSSTPGLNIDRTRARSRSTSRVDLPRSVESGTDIDDRNGYRRSEDDVPPSPPPKEARVNEFPRLGRTDSPYESFHDDDYDSPNLSRRDSGSDLSESSPVERMSHATFIAPALPPIRFSMNSADFSDLLSSVGGMPSLKSLDQLAKLEERSVPSTPPSTAISFASSLTTPTSGATKLGKPTPISTPRGSTPDPNEDNTATYPSDRPSDRAPESSHTRSDSSTSSHPAPGRSSTESQPPTLVSDSSESTTSTRITLTEPESAVATNPRHDTSDIVVRRLQESLSDAKDRGAQQLKLDIVFVEAILRNMEQKKAEYSDLKGNFDGVKRVSKQYIAGLTVAQTEYDRELKARRDAEAEVTRLRILLSGQAARLTALSGDSRKKELHQQMSKELNASLTGLEHDLSKLMVERDMTLAEVEELSASKSVSNGDVPAAKLGRSLTMRLDNIKTQYKHELVPLKQQREALMREITELRAVRDASLEETTVLNARNEELAQLSAQYARRIDAESMGNIRTSLDQVREKSGSFDRPRPNGLNSSITASSLYSDDAAENRTNKVQRIDPELATPSSKKFIKWGSKPKEIVPISTAPDQSKAKVHTEHTFQQLSVLRFTRCDQCGDKMWGSQLRCSSCNMSVHVRCINHVHTSCSLQSSATNRDDATYEMPPSMFGRDLTEQVHADNKDGERRVPVIVEKCIDAVEALAVDYEGIYRKTGGSGQSKAITQLFERGDYASFDLRDSDRFNDICSVTSVLKTYFRSLPVPLLTYDLHESFMSAVEIKDTSAKNKALLDLVNRLPNEHYYTLRMLMLHLNHIRQRSEINLMTARNLGVVFGPTLMRSRDPSAEFSDMAGKALSVEWLVENAPLIFNDGGSN